MTERDRESAEVEAGLRDRQATDQVRGERAPAPSPHSTDAHLVDQREADRELRGGHLDQPAPPLVAGRERLPEQVLEQEHLDTTLAHPRHELVVLVLRALDPQHVVEQQVVVVRRGQPLQAELGPVHHHLPEPAHLRVDAECRHLSSVPLGRLTTPPPGCPASPSTICWIWVERRRSRRALRSPPRSGRPPRPSAPSSRPGTRCCRELADGDRADPACCGVPQSAYTASTSVAITNRSAATSRASSSLARSLSMTASTPTRVLLRRSDGRNIVGTPPPPAQMSTTPWSRSQRIGTDLEDAAAARATARPAASCRRPA